jgi:hypothetical protein
MRVPCAIVLALLLFAGCAKKKEGPSRAEPAQPPVKIVFFFDDGSLTTETIAFANLKAADAILRPILARAFTKPEHGPRVVRWLLDDKRSWGPPASFRAQGVPWQMNLNATKSIYREYRVVPPLTGVRTIPEIESREDPKEAWLDCAGVPDPATGLKRAMEYLAQDLNGIRETQGVSPWPTH